MPSTRAQELAVRFESANLALIQLVQGCSDDQWRTLCNDEGENRTVAVIAHHCVHGNREIADWLQSVLDGREVTTTVEAIDQRNAEHSASYHEIGREETAALLEASGQSMHALIAGLSDEQLALSQPAGINGGRPMTAANFASLASRHLATHTATVRSALDL